MFRTAVAAALLLATLALTAFAQKDKDEKKGKLYKTPQEVFDAAEAAHAKKDFKTFAACLAPESQKNLASMLGFLAVEARRADKDTKDEEKRATLAKANKVLDKHGLTQKATKGVKIGETPKERKEASKAIDALIKDPEAFLAEMMPLSFLFARGKDEPKSKLTGVKINGDKASGTIITKGKDKGEERKEPMAFVKIKGGWRLNPFTEDDAKDKKDKDEAIKDK